MVRENLPGLDEAVLIKWLKIDTVAIVGLMDAFNLNLRVSVPRLIG
jgi:hypothetical protein